MLTKNTAEYTKLVAELPDGRDTYYRPSEKGIPSARALCLPKGKIKMTDKPIPTCGDEKQTPKEWKPVTLEYTEDGALLVRRNLHNYPSRRGGSRTNCTPICRHPRLHATLQQSSNRAAGLTQSFTNPSNFRPMNPDHFLA